MKFTIAFVAFLICFCHCTVRADTFGSGTNLFEIEFVTIGNTGNPPDTSGNPNPAGSIGYQYRIGKYEISEDMVNKANNLGGLGITHNNRGTNKPVTSVSWLEAATFINWLNLSTGNQPAYKIDSGTFQLWEPGDEGYDPTNLFRNGLSKYFLPSADEWYKAAYFDPINNSYHDYPTGSDNIPLAVANGTTADSAVYNQDFAIGPADINLAGGLSKYGTMGQGGNVFEWEETEYDLVNDLATAGRGIRGGGWDMFFHSVEMTSSARGIGFIRDGYEAVGFRIASVAVPEPRSEVLYGFAVIAIACARNGGRSSWIVRCYDVIPASRAVAA